MSTRCNIIVKDSEKALKFYHHQDGYPTNVGKELSTIVYEYIKQSSTSLVDMIKMKSNEYELEEDETTYLHGDIEYLYVLTEVNAQITIDCYGCSVYKDGKAKYTLVYTEIVNKNGDNSNVDYESVTKKYYEIPYDLRFKTISPMNKFIDDVFSLPLEKVKKTRAKKSVHTEKKSLEQIAMDSMKAYLISQRSNVSEEEIDKIVKQVFNIAVALEMTI